MEETLSSPLFWEGYPTHFSIDKPKLCWSMISGKLVYNKIVTNPILNSTCSNQDYNAAFSNFIKTSKQKNLPPKGVVSFNWSHVWCWILNKITIYIIAVLSEIHCCMTTIWGAQVQTGFWGFICSIPLILFSESDVSSLPNAYTIFIMNEVHLGHVMLRTEKKKL